MSLKIYHGSGVEDLAEKLAGELTAECAAGWKDPYKFLNFIFHTYFAERAHCGTCVDLV